MRYLWVLLAVLIANMGITFAAKLVVIRDDSASEEEDSEEPPNSEESKEIDLLLELIQEQRNRKHQPQQLRTIKVIRHKPTTEVVTQESIRKENVQKQPKMAKEYHVHYHNHQHPKPANPSLNSEEGNARPLMLDSLASHLDTFKEFYSLPQMEQTPLLRAASLEQFKKYKDFESLLETKDPFQTNDKSVDHGFELHSGMESLLPPTKKPKSGKGNIEVLKRYQALLNSRFTSHPPRYHHRPSRYQSAENFPNRDRFAGFTDFSTLENTPHKTKVVPNAEQPKSIRQDDLSIKDFAIVIKTKPRDTTLPTKKDTRISGRPPTRYRRPNPGLYKARLQQESRNVLKRPYKLPRILDAPGGAPKYIEKINGMKYGSDSGRTNVAPRHNANQNLNSIESQHRQMVQLSPFNRANMSNHVYNAWVMQRLLR